MTGPISAIMTVTIEIEFIKITDPTYIIKTGVGGTATAAENKLGATLKADEGYKLPAKIKYSYRDKNNDEKTGEIVVNDDGTFGFIPPRNQNQKNRDVIITVEFEEDLHSINASIASNENDIPLLAEEKMIVEKVGGDSKTTAKSNAAPAKAKMNDSIRVTVPVLQGKKLKSLTFKYKDGTQDVEKTILVVDSQTGTATSYVFYMPDADITVWDPSVNWTIEASSMQQNVDYTPYEGLEVQGRPRYVFVNGILAAENGCPTGKTAGKYVKR